MPVDCAFGTWCGSDSAQHVLSRVLILATRSSAVPFEVADQCLRVVADFPKIDWFAAIGEQEQPIELREKLGGWLMDRGEDCLTVVCELLQELDDRPRRLRVETRGGLIQEQQKFTIGVNAISTSSSEDGKKTYGLATSSTPIVNRFRCSTLRPSPSIPTTAFA